MSIRSQLAPLYFVVFIGFVGYSMTLPLFTVAMLSPQEVILPTHLAPSLRRVVLGVILLAYPLGQFFGSPVIGALSDRFGRKIILLLSLAMTTVCYAFVAFALIIHSLALLLIFLMLAGFSEGNIVITQSAISDLVKKDERQHRFGMIYFWASFAYIIGPVFGGRLADPKLVSWFNYSVPFWGMIVLLVPTIFWILFFFQETHPPKKRIKVRIKTAFLNLLTVFTNKRVRPFYFGNFLIYIAIFGFFRAFPMYAVDRFGIGIAKLSWFIAYISVPIMIVNLFFVKRLSKKVSPFHQTVFAGMLMGFSILIIIFPPEVQSLWITLFTTSIFLAICFTSSATTISHLAHPQEQGRVMGNNQALQVGAEALSSLLAGVVATINIHIPLAFFAALGIFSGVFIYFRGRKEKELAS